MKKRKISHLGADVIAVSNVTGEGIDELTALLADGKTAALLGSSGVGKSSLTNVICGDETMAVQDIREDDDKGRHTTTHRELFIIPTGGVLIDTPGMREFQLWDNSESLDSGFKDMKNLQLHVNSLIVNITMNRDAPYKKRLIQVPCPRIAMKAI